MRSETVRRAVGILLLLVGFRLCAAGSLDSYDDLKLYLGAGLIGIDYDAWAGDPAVERELYVVARLAAFPKLSFEAIMKELE